MERARPYMYVVIFVPVLLFFGAYQLGLISADTFAALEAHYQTLVRYLNLQDMGMVLGTGCGTPAMTARSPFPQAAYRLGRQLL